MSPSTIKYFKPSDKWFAKKKRKGIKIRIVARLNKIFKNMKIYTLYTRTKVTFMINFIKKKTDLMYNLKHYYYNMINKNVMTYIT